MFFKDRALFTWSILNGSWLRALPELQVGCGCGVQRWRLGTLDDEPEHTAKGKLESGRQKLEIGKERTETPHRSRCRALRGLGFFLLFFPALALRLRSGQAGWANFCRAYGAYLGATYFGT